MNTQLLQYLNRDVYREGRSIPRWERYENIDVGLDGNSCDHQRLTARHIRKYGKYDREAGVISPSQYIRLRLVGFFHDLPEYIGGDITGDDKHTIDTMEEGKNWNTMIARVLNNDFHNIESVDFVYQVDTNKKHELYTIFKLYEKIGYVYGAIIASERNDSEAKNLQWLCNNVIGNQLSMLIEQARIYPSIQNFLTDHVAQITRIIGIGSMHQDESNEKNIRFSLASEDWEQYVPQIQK